MPSESMTSMLFAASTSIALANAGSDKAWVSIPRNSGPSIFWSFAVIANCLSDGQDVPLVERHVKRRPAMAGRTEDDPLSGIGRIRPQLVIRCDELRDVNKNGWVSRFPGSRINCHAAPRRHPLRELRLIEIRAENRFGPA